MTLASTIRRILQQEDINFLLTNRLPRRWATLFMGWFSKIERPWVARCSITLLRAFAGADLREAKRQSFRSLHDCFTRELRDGARPVDRDPRLIVSPSDAIVGATGRVTEGRVVQVKGFPYALIDLLGDPDLVRHYEGGLFTTLRLTAGMYHRFHAPHDCCVKRVTYTSGDTWNVNPIALRRVERLFCKNERAILRCQLSTSNDLVTLVPVAAILVASIRLHFVDVLLHMRYRGPNVIDCNAELRKGDEMGWFQHGSTILVFAPRGLEFCEAVREGARLRMGQPLMRLSGGGPLVS